MTTSPLQTLTRTIESMTSCSCSAFRWAKRKLARTAVRMRSISITDLGTFSNGANASPKFRTVSSP